MAEVGSKKLSDEQIYEFLRNVNVSVRMNDLKCPSREFIIRVFECFLKDLHIDITSPDLRTWKSINHIEDVDIYEDVQSLILLAMSVNHLSSIWGIEITIRDIVEPKPKRTKKILNYLVVFWSYYVRKYANFRAIEESFETERKKIEDLIPENEALDEKYDNALKALQTMQRDNELPSIVKAKEEKLSKLSAESDALVSDYQALKSKELNVQNQIDVVDLQIISAKETREELNRLILSSPDRINTEIKNVEDRIKNEDVKVKEWENRCKDAVKISKLQKESLKEEKKCVNALNEMQEMYNNFRKTTESLIDINQKVNDEDEDLKHLEKDLEQKKYELLQLKQKSSQIGLTARKQVETLKGAYVTNQSVEAKEREKMDFLKVEVNNSQGVIDSETDSIFSVIEECKEAKARSKEREAQFTSKLNAHGSKFSSDCKEIVDVIRSTFECMYENESGQTRDK